MAKPGQEQHTARACTADEFKEVMEYAKQESEKKIEQPIYAFDNAPIHRAAMNKYPDMVPDSQYWSVPRYSPDFNKPIEHNHANVQRFVLKTTRFMPRSVELTAKDARGMCKDVFFGKTSVKGCKRDISSMPSTYQAVIVAKGHYPPDKYM